MHRWAGKARIRQVASLPHAWLPGWAVKDGDMQALHSWGPKNTVFDFFLMLFRVQCSLPIVNC